MSSKRSIPRGMIIIGTSGSHDYLKPHENDNKRFWPVSVMSPRTDDLASSINARLASDQRLRTVLDQVRFDGRRDLFAKEQPASIETHRDDPTKMEY